MTMHQSSTRPGRIRDLIQSELASPTGLSDESEDRRRYHRYTDRQFSGQLIVNGMEVPVRCRDLGHGGMCIEADGPVAVAEGERVIIRIEVWGRAFQDELSVVKVQPGDNGTTVHLCF